MTIDTPAARFLLLLGLGFFFGLAFEEFYASARQTRPGGVRTFPMLALVGALLYRLDPVRLLPFSVGLLVLGGWLAGYYWRHLGEADAEGRPNVGLMVPLCSVLAFLIGPVALAEPPWVAVGATVSGVLLLTAREKLHGFARRIGGAEIITAGKFLVLTGLVLPLLPDQPLTGLTDITPRQVWLAVLAVCTVSYASYLLQRYVAPAGAGLWVALLGGFYSSTATTVVLARHARADPPALRQAQTGIMLATSVMYLRLLIIIGVFSRPLALGLAPALLALSAAGLAMAGAWHAIARAPAGQGGPVGAASNPLELGAAAVFAALFVVISLVSGWALSQYGATGIYLLAAIVGVSDIDPFVLSLAGHATGEMPAGVGIIAILIATSSNNLLKAGYTMAFAGVRAGLAPAAALGLLALGGLGAAAWLAGLMLPVFLLPV
jgi:uncharacterized membrane protein (DUF4010 family)